MHTQPTLRTQALFAVALASASSQLCDVTRTDLQRKCEWESPGVVWVQLWERVGYLEQQRGLCLSA